MRNILILVVLTLLFSQCNRAVHVLEKEHILIRKTTIVAPFNTGRSDTSLFQYSGCGGLYIQNGSTSILIDPFFSNPSIIKCAFSTLRLGRIKSHEKDIEYGIKRIRDTCHLQNIRGVNGVLVAHGHYDHLMDVPYVYNNYLDPSTQVYCNKSSVSSIKSIVPIQQLVSIEENYSTINHVGRWYYFHNNMHDTIRVLPILSDHNPHFNGLQLYNGNTCDSCTKYGTYQDPLDKTNVNYWKEGKTFSFLIDFIKEGNITLRVFVQSSSCNGQAGFPPKELIDQKTVDVAFLGVASYQYSCDYPNEYIDYLKPTYISFIHWENFFRGYRKFPKKVLATDVECFFLNPKRPIHSTNYSMPAPGVLYKVVH